MCVYGDKCRSRHVEYCVQLNKRSKKGGAKATVALLKESTQLGCVSQESYPRKSILRDSGKLVSKHTVKFSRGTWHQIKIREWKGPSHGVMQYMSLTLSEKACLSVSQSSSVSERTERPVGERMGRLVEPTGQELNVANAQIRLLLDRQKERILAECRAESKKHGFQADYDRRSVRKLGEIIESQQEELHCAQAEEFHRRDQQLLHEEVSEFTFRHYCKAMISRGPGHYFGTYWQDTGFAK